jgi:hypothetical protein
MCEDHFSSPFDHCGSVRVSHEMYYYSYGRGRNNVYFVIVITLPCIIPN